MCFSLIEPCCFTYHICKTLCVYPFKFLNRSFISTFNMNSVTEQYKKCINEALDDAHSFNCQIGEDKLRKYHGSLVNSLGGFKNFDKTTQKDIREYFKQAKEKNRGNTGKVLLTFSLDKCKATNDTFSGFGKFIKDIEVENEEKLIPGLGHIVNFIDDLKNLIGDMDELRQFSEMIPKLKFCEVFKGDKIQIQRQKYEITGKIEHLTLDEEKLFAHPIEAELFVKAPQNVEAKSGNNVEFVEIIENKVPKLRLNAEEEFLAKCMAFIKYKTEIGVEGIQLKSVEWRSEDFKVTITGSKSMFLNPKYMNAITTSTSPQTDENQLQTPSFPSEDLIFEIQLDSITYATTQQYSNVCIHEYTD